MLGVDNRLLPYPAYNAVGVKYCTEVEFDKASLNE